MGKFLAALIVGSALLAGAGIYYTQVYAYYETLPATGPADVEAMGRDSGQPENVPHSAFEAIDASSSPIRYRACFVTDLTPEELSARYQPFEDPVPLTAPGWFSCFDAGVITEALEAGTARAVLGQGNIHYGVDRIVAVDQDGHGYVWHQLNECGEMKYDGTPRRTDCPEPPKGN